jgi:hypothetical protein
MLGLEIFGAVAGGVSIVDIAINRCESFAARVNAAKGLKANAERILGICKQVRALAEKNARFSFDESTTEILKSALQDVSNIVRQYDDDCRVSKFKRSAMAKYRSSKLVEIEHKMRTVLDLINAAVNTDTNEIANAIRRDIATRHDTVIQEIQNISLTQDRGAENANEIPDEWVPILLFCCFVVVFFGADSLQVKITSRC